MAEMALLPEMLVMLYENASFDILMLQMFRNWQLIFSKLGPKLAQTRIDNLFCEFFSFQSFSNQFYLLIAGLFQIWLHKESFIEIYPC